MLLTTHCRLESAYQCLNLTFSALRIYLQDQHKPQTPLACCWDRSKCLNFGGAFAKLPEASLCVCLSAWNNSAATRRNFMKFDICIFFETLSRKFKFHENMTRITGTLHQDRSTFIIISRSFLLRMRNTSEKSCRGTQNTHFVANSFFSKIVQFMR
jgi:hypothetical protein